MDTRRVVASTARTGDELQTLQLERLQATLRRVYERVPHYRRAFDEAGVRPADVQTLGDLAAFPFTTKEDLRANYPFGLFAVPRNPAIVPDVLLSLDVTVPEDWWRTRSYFVWEFGKAPDVVIEIVSNTKGEEQGTKRRDYARIGIPYYIVYDPRQHLRGDVLEVYELRAREYERRADTWLTMLTASHFAHILLDLIHFRAAVPADHAVL